MAITKLVIDRKYWGRGALLLPDGKMCCLGHASVACGVPKEQLMINSFRSMLFPYPGWINVNVWLRSTAPPRSPSPRSPALIASDLNDSYDPQREQKLIALFSNNGIELSFIGEFDVES